MLLHVQPAQFDTCVEPAWMLGVDVGHLVSRVCPEASASAGNFPGPCVKQVVADVKRVGTQIRDHFPVGLGGQKTCPFEMEIVKVAQNSACHEPSQSSDKRSSGRPLLSPS